MSDEISPEVDKLIREQIHSVEKLEVLLLLAGTPEKWWNAAQVASSLYRQAASVEVHLNALHTAQLLAKREVQTPLFRYSPASEVLDGAVKALEKAYRERKDTVIRLIFASPPDALRSFANAFRLR